MRHCICWRLLQSMIWLGVVAASEAQATNSIHVPFVSDRWHITGGKPDVQFLSQEGFPQGLLVLKSGSATLNGLKFRNGIIEFDMKGIGEDIPGVQFRQQGALGAQNAEELYVRISPNCRASNDCVQYTPRINGFMLWNSYPQYQTRAFILDGWNHFKLVVSGHRMNVYINGLPNPALAVGSLEGNSMEGGLEFSGPAFFANLTVTPDAVEGLSPERTPDPTDGDRGIVRHWRLGPLASFHVGVDPKYADLPDPPNSWRSVTAGRFGMVNLNRAFTFTNQRPSLTWLRTSVTSDRGQSKRVSLGWIGQVWVFVNGRLVTQGKNFYNAEGERRGPDGRLSFENGSFEIPLNRGKNEIVIALFPSINDNPEKPNRYGWAIGMRYDNVSGLMTSK
jgi:hypothetical protein